MNHEASMGWTGTRRTLLGAALALAGLPAVAQAPVEITIPALTDFSGPFADLAKQLAARGAVARWWNDTEGKKLGIKLTVKEYDTRYDGTVVASMWPGILTDHKPVIAMGLGGADQAALQQRLGRDKVPVTYAPPAYGYGWLPNQWVFGPRATYGHEYATALRWFIDQNPGKRPVRVAFMSSQASPAYVDIVKGLTHYVKTVLEPKGLAVVAATEWVDQQPVDVSTQMKTIIDAKADVLFGIANTTLAAAQLRAQQLHGVKIPTIASPWHTIWPLATAMKSYAPWEGHIVVTGLVSFTERESPAFKFYQELNKNYGLPADWNPLNLLGISQGLLTVRAVEHAARKVGATKLTGEAVYDALANGTYTDAEFFGFMSGFSFNKEAPFPSMNARVKIETVKDGKMVLATPQGLPVVADLTKW
jgi:branched-chain amino acid transport system substrate-binding protein